MFGVGAAGEDIDVIVRAARLARVEGGGREQGVGATAAPSNLRLAAQLAARKRHSHIMHHRVLHRDLQPPALAGTVASIEGSQDACRHQHAGSGVAERRPWLYRRTVGISGDADRTAGGLGDHVESEISFVRAALAKAFDLAVDDARVQLLNDIVTEAEAFDRAGRHVLDRDIGLLQQVFDDLQPARGLQIEGDRLLVGVELVKIPGVVIRLAREQPSARVAGLRVLDLDDLGAEPGERFGAGRPRLELRKVDNPNTFETIQLDAISIHLLSLLPKSQAGTISRDVTRGKPSSPDAAQSASSATWSNRRAVSVSSPDGAKGCESGPRL